MRKILLVECAQEKAADLAEHLSENPDYWVELVQDPGQALGMLGPDHRYACIVASYEMPGMSGIELIQKIRTFDKRVGVVVVADCPAKAEKETGDLDVMGVVDREKCNGSLLEMVASAVEMKEIPQEHFDHLNATLGAETVKLRDIHTRRLDAPGFAS